MINYYFNHPFTQCFCEKLQIKGDLKRPFLIYYYYVLYTKQMNKLYMVVTLVYFKSFFRLTKIHGRQRLIDKRNYHAMGLIYLSANRTI